MIKQITEENKELLDLAVQNLCVMRIIKDYCHNNMDIDECFELEWLISSLMKWYGFLVFI